MELKETQQPKAEVVEARGIHSMELKGIVANSTTQYTVLQESIQWN